MQKDKGKPSILLGFLKKYSASGGLAHQTPLLNAAFIPFRTSMLIYICLREICAK